MSDWFERFGFAEVAPGLLSGAYPLDAGDVDEIAAAGADVLYNLCEDGEYGEGERDAVVARFAAGGLSERRLPLVDYEGIAAEDLERAVAEVLEDLDAGHTVYLHCRAGWQRSAAVAAGVIALREELEVDDALRVLRERRPTAEPLDHQRDDLRRWFAERQA